MLYSSVVTTISPTAIPDCFIHFCASRSRAISEGSILVGITLFKGVSLGFRISHANCWSTLPYAFPLSHSSALSFACTDAYLPSHPPLLLCWLVYLVLGLFSDIYLLSLPRSLSQPRTFSTSTSQFAIHLSDLLVVAITIVVKVRECPQAKFFYWKFRKLLLGSISTQGCYNLTASTTR